MRNPFRYFSSIPEVIRLAVMMYIRYPLSFLKTLSAPGTLAFSTEAE